MSARGDALLSDEFEVGRIVAGKYRIESVIGEGGLGRVLAATHLELDQLVAIKHLKREFGQQPVLGERFAREARLAARIRSDHVVRVLDVAKTVGGCTYIIMEYLEGKDLGQVLAEAGSLPIVDAIDYVLQACEALAEAHAIGVVHRDLKPDNLFLAKRAAGSSILKVLDFGISKVLVAPTGPGPVRPRALTTDTDRLGTPAYMSPEQIRASTDVDVRADIWAMGVVLYELLSGKMPFRSEHIPMLCVQIATEQPSPMERADLPPDLVAVVTKCLEKDRAQRYRNIAELSVDLAPFGPADAAARADHVRRVVVAAGGSIRPPAPSSAALPAPGDPTIASPAKSTISSWAPDGVTKRRSVGLLALAATLVGGLAVGFFMLRARSPATDAPREPTDRFAAANASPWPVPSPIPSPPATYSEVVAAAPDSQAPAPIAVASVPLASPAPAPASRPPRAGPARPAPAPSASAATSKRKNAEFGDRQ